MLSLDYDDTLMAAAGHQAEAIFDEIITQYKGNCILAVEGDPPLNEDGMYSIHGCKPFVEMPRRVAKDAKAVIAWGSCASWGRVQAAKPNPTKATPIHKGILDKPIVKVPACPPIPEVMTAVVTYMLTFDRLPTLQARDTIHDRHRLGARHAAGPERSACRNGDGRILFGGDPYAQGCRCRCWPSKAVGLDAGAAMARP